MTQAVTQPSKTPSAANDLPDVRIALIQARWHADIVDQARLGFLDEIAGLGVPGSAVDCYDVPGAFEIPLHAQTLARSGRYAAIVATGLVVDGGIYRHDFVAQAVINGLMQVQLATGTPVFSVVLTPHEFRDSDPVAGFFREHFVLKGREAAQACAMTLANRKRLRTAETVTGMGLANVG